MTSTPSESSEPKDSSNPDKDIDPSPACIPLRQRRLPASFWQEPSIVPNTPLQDNHPRTGPAASLQPFHQTASQFHPWTISMGGGATLPTFLPQRLTVPNSYALVQHPSSMWIRSPSMSYCNCAVCLNYSCITPRIPNMYNSLRYASTASCSPGSKCADLSCKLCASSVNWYPERVRQSRFRSARYNALLD